MANIFYGIDVSKATLEIASGEDCGTRTINNNPASITQWLNSLRTSSLIGLESTGDYHSLMANMAHEAGHTVFILQPRYLKNYAQGVGVRIKSDASDAEVIHRYISREYKDLRSFTPASELVTRLQKLVKRRAALTKARMSVKQSLRGLDLLEENLKVFMRDFDRFIGQIDRKMLCLIREDVEFNAQRERLATIPGIGPVTSVALAALFKRFSFGSADSVVSYVGLDPKVRQSGTWVGKRRISKRGPGELRRLLYIAALTASRKTAWREIYNKHKAKGLPSTACMVILSRKILKTAFGIWNKPGELYDEKMIKRA